MATCPKSVSCTCLVLPLYMPSQLHSLALHFESTSGSVYRKEVHASNPRVCMGTCSHAYFCFYRICHPTLTVKFASATQCSFSNFFLLFHLSAQREGRNHATNIVCKSVTNHVTHAILIMFTTFNVQQRYILPFSACYFGVSETLLCTDCSQIS